MMFAKLVVVFPLFFQPISAISAMFDSASTYQNTPCQVNDGYVEENVSRAHQSLYLTFPSNIFVQQLSDA
jgi:hypothetical protein